ncbi:iron-sulfur protein [Streptomyces sp. I05A-00742]|uniref:iron-sulfur protein n=1 Tax=Streptomyces sp. I05A-00742 TaxID=2732853 RepID=UPI00201729ED|nr:iron-sulfur protein [Streptomyces sp. I05A-00742]
MGAYTRLTEVHPALRVVCAPPRAGKGWITAAQLAAGGSAVDAFTARDREQALLGYGRPLRPDVAAGLGLYRYAWSVSLLLTLPWFLHRRVPLLPFPAVSVHRARGTVSLAPTGFACLPGDPVAVRPDAVPVADEAALRKVVREGVAGQVGPVLEGFRGRTRRGTRALWGLMTDAATESLWRLARLLGEEARAGRELRLLLPGDTAPFAGGAAFRELTVPGGGSVLTRDRASCCLVYTARPTSCLTCPRTHDADRITRLSTT